MFCQNCGTQNSDGVKFCNNCGAPLQAAPRRNDGFKPAVRTACTAVCASIARTSKA